MPADFPSTDLPSKYIVVSAIPWFFGWLAQEAMSKIKMLERILLRIVFMAG